MFEALEYYQSLAEKFQSQLLTGPGIAIVLAGLCIWLAGLRWRKILAGLAGASIALAGVLAIGDYPATVILGVCLVGVIIGVVASGFVLGMFGAITGALVVMVILSGGLRTSPQDNNMIEFFDADSETYNPDEITVDDFVSEYSYPMWGEYEGDVVITAPQALDITATMANYFVDSAKKAIRSTGTASYAGAGFAAIIIVVIALVASRLFIAAASATMGSAIIFVGMIMLLFYKGSQPVNYIASRPQFYAIAFGAMVVFGTVVQLVLTPVQGQKIERKSKKKNGDEK